ncbi:MAG: ketol-acid reductoisomerase [Candidatus Marinimicrobia bacterium]|nr:ketol-acid reductoisomerase [Candidatus Neomarinimicrobiota bacterium]
MATIYYDKDVSLDPITGKTIAIIGYGNQGRAQALNLQDSGLEVIIGNIEDDFARAAAEDGFSVFDIASAAKRADILSITVPDEIQPDVFQQSIIPQLRPNQVVNFSHGYNIRYGKLDLPESVDITLVAPRMIGVGVRETFQEGSGAPAFIAVEQDFSGQAWEVTLALAKGIGATQAGALKSTFAEETELDLFSEQAVWPAFIRILTLSYELLSSKGYQPEAILTELYASGEAARVFRKMADVGLFQQMNFHSQTSQYGTLTRSDRVIPDEFMEVLKESLTEIRDDSFAKEWEHEKDSGYPRFKKLKEQAFQHEINSIEEALHNQLEE